MDKPIIVFTNFWDANKIIGDQYFFENIKGINYKIILHQEHLNYKIMSIALSHPPLNQLTNIKKEFEYIDRIDVFCPTYNMLVDYKEENNWEKYTERFKELMIGRKKEIQQWVKSLKDNFVYFLCCWENTSGKSHCHREIIYSMFLSSEQVKNRIICLYRDGGRQKNSDVIRQEFYQNNSVSIFNRNNAVNLFGDEEVGIFRRFDLSEPTFEDLERMEDDWDEDEWENSGQNFDEYIRR